MLNRWHLLMFVAVLYLCGSCVEIIEFDTTRAGNRLVVDGKITQSAGPHVLLLGSTAERDRIPFPVHGAQARLMDDQGHAVPFVQTAPGRYEASGMQGMPGRAYSIRIELANGRVYESRPQLMPSVRAYDSLSYDFAVIDELNDEGNLLRKRAIQLYVETFIPNGEQTFFLKWDVEAVYMLIQTIFPSPFPVTPEICYISTFPNQQDLPLYNGSRLRATHLPRQRIATKHIDHSFYTRQYFNVYVSSMTAEAHTYWSQVNEIVNRTGSIFDTPPAPIQGNVYNPNNPEEEVLGFFEAALVDTSRFFVVKTDVPFFVETLCEYDWRKPRSEYHKACFDCLEMRNSTKVRPPYWGK